MMKHKIFRIAIIVLLFSVASIDEAKAVWYGARVNAAVVQRTGTSVYGGKVMVHNYDGDQEYGYTSSGGSYTGAGGNNVNITMNAQADAGYRFSGWFSRQEDTTPESTLNTYTKSYATATSIYTSIDYFIYAKFTPKQYTLHYDINGGSIYEPIPDSSYTIEDVFNLPECIFAKDGYGFVGWKPTSNSGNWRTTDFYEDEAEISGKYGDVTLQAQWELRTFTIYYDANGGSVSQDTQEYNINSTDPLLTPTRNGYRFIGWKVVDYDLDDGNWEEGIAESPLNHKFGDVWLQAQWEKEVADITIIVTGLEEGESAIFTVTKVDPETLLYTVSVTGNSSGTSSVTIKSLETGSQYQVRPINAWTWTYDMDPNGGMVIGLGASGATFEFEATKKDPVKKHDEKSNTNWR